MTQNLRSVALHAIDPDGRMRTVEDDLPLPEVRALRKQVRDVETGPHRLEPVIPRLGRKPASSAGRPPNAPPPSCWR
ncbi:MAG: hypothetical protein M0026_03650 [Nocardiopsaceae bacterium]|jgi:hypothetical protein|nr:hypothetical protein [Nocardiopsaceae bacterium]